MNKKSNKKNNEKQLSEKMEAKLIKASFKTRKDDDYYKSIQIRCINSLFEKDYKYKSIEFEWDTKNKKSINSSQSSLIDNIYDLKELSLKDMGISGYNQRDKKIVTKTEILNNKDEIAQYLDSLNAVKSSILSSEGFKPKSFNGIAFTKELVKNLNQRLDDLSKNINGKFFEQYDGQKTINYFKSILSNPLEKDYLIVDGNTTWAHCYLDYKTLEDEFNNNPNDKEAIINKYSLDETLYVKYNNYLAYTTNIVPFQVLKTNIFMSNKNKNKAYVHRYNTLRLLEVLSLSAKKNLKTWEKGAVAEFKENFYKLIFLALINTIQKFNKGFDDEGNYSINLQEISYDMLRIYCESISNRFLRRTCAIARKPSFSFIKGVNFVEYSHNELLKNNEKMLQNILSEDYDDFIEFYKKRNEKDNKSYSFNNANYDKYMFSLGDTLFKVATQNEDSTDIGDLSLKYKEVIRTGTDSEYWSYYLRQYANKDITNFSQRGNDIRPLYVEASKTDKYLIENVGIDNFNDKLICLTDEFMQNMYIEIQKEKADKASKTLKTIPLDDLITDVVRKINDAETLAQVICKLLDCVDTNLIDQNTLTNYILQALKEKGVKIDE